MWHSFRCISIYTKIEPKILDVENSETKIDYERNITILENIYSKNDRY